MALGSLNKITSRLRQAAPALGLTALISCASDDSLKNPESFDAQEFDYSASPANGLISDSDDGIEDFTIGDYQSFDPSGIHIPFEFDKATLTEEGRQALDRIIDGMQSDPLARLMIRGHADKQGKEKHNEALSARRSEVIENYLVKNGIDKERLRSVHLGDREPLVDEERVSAYRKNRRGDFQINYGPSVFGQ